MNTVIIFLNLYHKHKTLKMKKNIATILTLVAIVLTTISCKEKAKEAVTTDAKEVKTVEEEPKVTVENYNVDVENSSIEWTGFKPTESHNGTLSLKNGTLSITEGKISGGTFTIDMNSIVVLDIPADKKGNAKLVGHLKHDDFFGVEKHPTATFEITSVNKTEGKTMMSGNLTLKGIKHNITFPVTTSNDEGTMTLTSEAFSIDRTKWDIKFSSKTFFEDLVGNKIINDNIEIKITVKATKA